jgi:hypothetical protein
VYRNSFTSWHLHFCIYPFQLPQCFQFSCGIAVIKRAASVAGFERLFFTRRLRNRAREESSAWWLSAMHVSSFMVTVTESDFWRTPSSWTTRIHCNLYVVNTVKNCQERNLSRVFCSEIDPQDELHRDIPCYAVHVFFFHYSATLYPMQ